jgi:hypothetical protein
MHFVLALQTVDARGYTALHAAAETIEDLYDDCAAIPVLVEAGGEQLLLARTPDR